MHLAWAWIKTVLRFTSFVADPTNDGEITYNGTKFRAKENGTVKDLIIGGKLTLICKASAVITTGLKSGSVTPTESGNWTKWTLITDEANSTVVVNVKKNGTNIFTTNKPTLTAQKNNSGTNMSGTTTAYSVGDYFEIDIESNNNSHGLTLILE